jgi:hypothetical protein
MSLFKIDNRIHRDKWEKDFLIIAIGEAVVIKL